MGGMLGLSGPGMSCLDLQKWMNLLSVIPTEARER